MDKQDGGMTQGRAYLFRGVMVVCWVVLSTILYTTLIFISGPFSQRIAIMIGQAWCRHYLFMSGVRVRVKGAEKLSRNSRYVFMANHQSAMDIPVLYANIPFKTSFIAKKELFYTPMYGWAMAVIGHIWIDRSNARKARVTITRAVDKLKKRQFSLVIFPEGTRSVDGIVGEFKKGSFTLALEAGSEIVPVAISGVKRILPKKAWFARSGEVLLEMGDPISVEGLGIADKPMLAEKVRSAVVAMVRAE